MFFLTAFWLWVWVLTRLQRHFMTRRIQNRDPLLADISRCLTSWEFFLWENCSTFFQNRQGKELSWSSFLLLCWAMVLGCLASDLQCTLSQQCLWSLWGREWNLLVIWGKTYGVRYLPHPDPKAGKVSWSQITMRERERGMPGTKETQGQ